MGLVRGQRVKLAPGVERPENEHGEVDEGMVECGTPFGDVLVSFPGAGGEFFHPDELIPIGEPEDLPPLFDGPGGEFGSPGDSGF